jgi:hypothetical protein
LANCWNSAAHSRICDTLPADDSIKGDCKVWIESTIISCGFSFLFR